MKLSHKEKHKLIIIPSIFIIFFFILAATVSSVFAASKEIYNHKFGYSITIADKYANDVIIVNDENVIAPFRDEGGNDVKFVIHVYDMYKELDRQTLDENGYDENDINLQNPIFADTYRNNTYIVNYLGNKANDFSSGEKETIYVQTCNINGVTYWVSNFRFLDSSGNKTGEGKIYLTIFRGKRFEISIINKSTSLASIPEVNQTLASLTLGRKVSPAMKYIWIIVGFLNLSFFLLMMWIITRPRKYSRRQMIRREQKALRKAARKGLPPPTPEISSEMQLVPVQRELPKLYHFKETRSLSRVALAIANKKATALLDAILERGKPDYESYDYALDTDKNEDSIYSIPLEESAEDKAIAIENSDSEDSGGNDDENDGKSGSDGDSDGEKSGSDGDSDSGKSGSDGDSDSGKSGSDGDSGKSGSDGGESGNNSSGQDDGFDESITITHSEEEAVEIVQAASDESKSDTVSINSFAQSTTDAITIVQEFATAPDESQSESLTASLDRLSPESKVEAIESGEGKSSLVDEPDVIVNSQQESEIVESSVAINEPELNPIPQTIDKSNGNRQRKQQKKSKSKVDSDKSSQLEGDSDESLRQNNQTAVVTVGIDENNSDEINKTIEIEEDITTSNVSNFEQASPIDSESQDKETSQIAQLLKGAKRHPSKKPDSDKQTNSSKKLKDTSQNEKSLVKDKPISIKEPVGIGVNIIQDANAAGVEDILLSLDQKSSEVTVSSPLDERIYKFIVSRLDLILGRDGTTEE